MSVEDKLTSNSKRKTKDKKKDKYEQRLVDRRSEGEVDATAETNNSDKGLTEKTRKEKEKKKRKYHKLSAEDENGDVREREHSKKRKTREKSFNDEKPEGEKPSKSKRKHSRQDEDAPREEDPKRDTEPPPRKSSDKESRKKSNKHSKRDDAISLLPNPTEDATLTEKSRSALSYAYARLASSKSWKFNKAHQNWIAKHFFSLDAVPEKYIPVVVGYLSGCQGAVRQNLIDACNKQLEPASANSETTVRPDSDAQSEQPMANNTAAEPDNSVSEKREMLETRARTLLKALESSSS